MQKTEVHLQEKLRFAASSTLSVIHTHLRDLKLPVTGLFSEQYP
ncbi:hypothetical protein [Nitrosomonas sp.]|nr:hypothetical protein [Nitrosomonas sp.]